MIAILPLVVFSQDGSPDLSFGNDGVIEHDLNGGEESLYDSDQGISGRIVAVGINYDPNSGVTKNFIAAFNEDGSFDTAFNQNGFLLVDEANSGTFYDVQVQDDNKILVGSGSSSNYKISRYLDDGNLDASFANNGVLTPLTSGETGRSFVLGPNGNILISGKNGSLNIVLKQFLANGTLDPSFGVNGVTIIVLAGISSLSVRSLRLQENGSIIVSCSFRENAISSNNVVRFLSNGDIDTSYGLNGIALVPVDEEFSCTSLPFQDGSVLSSCLYYDWLLEILVRKVTKLSPNGSLDTNFGAGGHLNGYYGSIIQPNQRVITDQSVSDLEGGSVLGYRRLYSNGSIDQSLQFSSNYFDSLGNTSPILLNSGKMFVASSDIWYNAPDINIILQRFNNNPLGVQEFDSNKFKVFPNPSMGIFTISHASTLESDVPYQIFDTTARIIETGVLSGDETLLDLTSLQSGIYFLKVANTSLQLIKN